MHTTPSTALDRIGAAAGIAAVVLLLALFTVFPALPAPNKPIGEIAAKATQNREGLLLGAYAGALLSGALIVFGTSIAARLRRAEGEEGGWWLLALAGIAGTSIGIIGNALEIMFIRAAAHGVDGRVLWLGYGGDHWVSVLVAVPLAIFFLATGMGARATAVLPRWLTWLSLTLSALFLVGAASVTGDEVDGGILGLPLLAAYLGLLVWIIGASTAGLRRARETRPVPATG